MRYNGRPSVSADRAAASRCNIRSYTWPPPHRGRHTGGFSSDVCLLHGVDCRPEAGQTGGPGLLALLARPALHDLHQPRHLAAQRQSHRAGDARTKLPQLLQLLKMALLLPAIQFLPLMDHPATKPVTEAEQVFTRCSELVPGLGQHPQQPVELFRQPGSDVSQPPALPRLPAHTRQFFPCSTWKIRLRIECVKTVKFSPAEGSKEGRYGVCALLDPADIVLDLQDAGVGRGQGGTAWPALLASSRCFAPTFHWWFWT